MADHETAFDAERRRPLQHAAVEVAAHTMRGGIATAVMTPARVP